MRTPSAVPVLTAVPFRVKAYGEELLTASSIFDDVGTFAAGPATASGLRGSADAAYQSSRAGLGSTADACSLAMRGVAGVVLDHAADLDRLSVELTDLQDRYSHLVQLDQQLEQGLVAGPAHLPPAQIDAQLDAYEADRSRWLRELATSETGVIAALERVMTLEQVQQRYGGVADPADAVLPTMPGPGATPAAVRRWWDSLTGAQRSALIVADPDALGDRDGIPAWARDRANVVRLLRDQQELGHVPPGQLSDPQRDRLANATATQEALDRMAGAYDPLTGGHYPTQLYTYDPDAFGGDGRVAIALGDLDTADNVGITVPGLGTDATSAPVQSTKAINLQQAADFLGRGHSNATMFWIGYDAPDNTPWGDGGYDAAGVTTPQLASAGGHQLATTLDGIQHMRAHDPHLTVIGHSYGSTTASLGSSYAAPGQVDDLVLVGSPGAGPGIDHASETGVSTGHVWDGRNSGDPVALIGNHGLFNLHALGAGLGTDPASDTFGAHRFEAQSVTGGGPLADHLKYFDHDSESLANMAHIVNGDYSQVVGAPPVHDPLLPAPEHHLVAIAQHVDGALGDLGDAVLHPSSALSDVLDGVLQADGAVDDVVGGPVDPEASRRPTAPDTNGW